MSAAGNHEPFVVYPNRAVWATQMFFCVVLTPILVAVAVPFTVGLFYLPRSFWTELGVLLALAFQGTLDCVAVYWLARSAWELPWLLRRAPLLVIDERGVMDRSSPSAVGFVGREEIEAIFVCRYSRPSSLGL